MESTPSSETAQPVSDETLIAASKDGDNSAFAALARRYEQSLLRTARSLTHNRADAEDVVQETFLAAYRGIGAFAGRSSVKTWLTRILLRTASRAWKRGRRRREVTDAHARWSRRVQDEGADDRRASDRERALEVIRALGSLDPAHRRVIVLRELRGMSYAQIARTLAVPRGTVGSRLARAREALREIVGRSD